MHKASDLLKWQQAGNSWREFTPTIPCDKNLLQLSKDTRCEDLQGVIIPDFNLKLVNAFNNCPSLGIFCGDKNACNKERIVTSRSPSDFKAQKDASYHDDKKSFTRSLDNYCANALISKNRFTEIVHNLSKHLGRDISAIDLGSGSGNGLSDLFLDEEISKVIDFDNSIGITLPFDLNASLGEIDEASQLTSVKKEMRQFVLERMLVANAINIKPTENEKFDLAISIIGYIEYFPYLFNVRDVKITNYILGILSTMNYIHDGGIIMSNHQLRIFFEYLCKQGWLERIDNTCLYKKICTPDYESVKKITTDKKFDDKIFYNLQR